jgi:hypothetical protein
LCSTTFSFCRTGRRVPPGVCCTTTVLGVEGTKKGDDGTVRGVDDDGGMSVIRCSST